MQNLAHSASFHSRDKNAPSNPGTKHLVRETGWQPAELAKRYRVQLLLGRTVWDADALRERMRAEVLATLGDPSGVLVVAETDFLKKGTHSVGVKRQHSGTTGTDRLRHQDRDRALT